MNTQSNKDLDKENFHKGYRFGLVRTINSDKYSYEEAIEESHKLT